MDVNREQVVVSPILIPLDHLLSARAWPVKGMPCNGASHP